MTTILFLLKWLFLLTGAAVWIGLIIIFILAVILYLLCPAQYKH
jgi:hypothetical protein